MRSLSVREQRALLLLGCLWAAVVVPVGVHKGPDFVAELGQAERLLHGRPLFEDVSTSLGLPWPPFSALALVPFALVAAASVPLAKACWALAGVACVVWTGLAPQDHHLVRIPLQRQLHRRAATALGLFQVHRGRRRHAGLLHRLKELRRLQ